MARVEGVGVVTEDRIAMIVTIVKDYLTIQTPRNYIVTSTYLHLKNDAIDTWSF